MKTAEEWLKELGDNNHRSIERFMLPEDIRAIQQDAIREGMTRAAGIAELEPELPGLMPLKVFIENCSTVGDATLLMRSAVGVTKGNIITRILAARDDVK